MNKIKEKNQNKKPTINNNRQKDHFQRIYKIEKLKFNNKWIIEKLCTMPWPSVSNKKRLEQVTLKEYASRVTSLTERIFNHQIKMSIIKENATFTITKKPSNKQQQDIEREFKNREKDLYPKFSYEKKRRIIIKAILKDKHDLFQMFIKDSSFLKIQKILLGIDESKKPKKIDTRLKKEFTIYLTRIIARPKILEIYKKGLVTLIHLDAYYKIISEKRSTSIKSYKNGRNKANKTKINYKKTKKIKIISNKKNLLSEIAGCKTQTPPPTNIQNTIEFQRETEPKEQPFQITLLYCLAIIALVIRIAYYFS